MAKLQAYAFCGSIYPDSTSYDCNEVLDSIKSYFDKWAYCLHDKDIEEDGTPKKAHIHWVGRKKAPALLSTISNKLGLPENAIEVVKQTKGKTNWKGVVRYLNHDNAPEKYQYSVDSVVSNFDIKKFLSDKDNVLMIKQIVGFIRENPTASYEDVLEFSCDNGCYSEFKSACYVINKIMTDRKRQQDKIDLEKWREIYSKELDDLKKAIKEKKEKEGKLS